ncbi:MAG: tRNA pseudouridine(38-40) synthase TruA [Deltaproteobacteria bacterium]
MRFAVRLSFNGNDYFGWQSQEGENTVQDIISGVLRIRYNRPIEITGCCRTDSGVHASDFLFHFDFEEDIRDDFINSINKMLPPQIALHDIRLVPDNFHSRFDAVSRSYVYYIHIKKDPFKYGFSFYFPVLAKADFELMNKATEIIKKYQEFYPFCKSKSDVKTMKCNIEQLDWIKTENGFAMQIKADRFLRGMVRLIVGACINTGLYKISPEELEQSLNNQERLKKSWSVPAHGLFLNEVKYLTQD